MSLRRLTGFQTLTDHQINKWAVHLLLCHRLLKAALVQGPELLYLAWDRCQQKALLD